MSVEYRPYLKSYAVLNYYGKTFITPCAQSTRGYTVPLMIPTKLIYHSRQVAEVTPGVLGCTWIKNIETPSRERDYKFNLYDFIENEIYIVNMVQGGNPLHGIIEDVPTLHVNDWYCWILNKAYLHKSVIDAEIHSFALHSTEKVVYKYDPF